MGTITMGPGGKVQPIKVVSVEEPKIIEVQSPPEIIKEEHMVYVENPCECPELLKKKLEEERAASSEKLGKVQDHFDIAIKKLLANQIKLDKSSKEHLVMLNHTKSELEKSELRLKDLQMKSYVVIGILSILSILGIII